MRPVLEGIYCVEKLDKDPERNPLTACAVYSANCPFSPRIAIPVTCRFVSFLIWNSVLLRLVHSSYTWLTSSAFQILVVVMRLTQSYSIRVICFDPASSLRNSYVHHCAANCSVLRTLSQLCHTCCVPGSTVLEIVFSHGDKKLALFRPGV